MKAIVDALCHLEDPRVEDVAAVLERAREAGVTDVISAGTDPLQDPLELLSKKRTDIRVWRAYGLHPMAVGRRPLEEQVATLKERLAEPGVVALGECGLDGRDGMPPMDLQERAFREQLGIAKARGLPLLLHGVRATGRLLDVLEEEGPFDAGGIVHGFAGAPEVLSRLLGLGLSVSFGGVITREITKKGRRSAAEVPKERLLVESDAPDHPPRGWQGRLSEPACLPITLRALAELRGALPEELAAQTAANARRMFFLPEPGPVLAG